MNIEYRENTLTAEEYLYLERQVGEQMTTTAQVKRALEHRHIQFPHMLTESLWEWRIS